MLRIRFVLCLALCTVITARAAVADLLISEIMFNPASPEDDWEWVELFNNGDSAIDLAGFVIDDNNSTPTAIANIVAGTIGASSTAVLYNADDLSAAQFTAAWGEVGTLIGISGWSVFSLNNGGDTIGLWESFADYDGDHATHAHAFLSLAYDGSLDDDNASIYLTDLDDPDSFSLSVLGLDGAIVSQINGTTNVGGEVGSPGVVSAIPVPAALPLLGSALVGLISVSRRNGWTVR